MKYILQILIYTILLFPVACGKDVKTEAKYPTGADRSGAPDIYSKPESVFGPSGLSLGGDKKAPTDGLVVNVHLWRGALDTVSFMPLASADPFGGTILTDWYSAPQTPNERFKINVFIMGSELRSDAVRVKVFRQIASGGQWRNASSNVKMERTLEDTILTRARQMRVGTLDRKGK